MLKKVDFSIVLMGKLTIYYAEEMKLTLLEALNQGNSIEVDLSTLDEVDISGLQLLVSFAKEAVLLGKDYSFKGIFKENFKECINQVSYSSIDMVNGEDLTLFIKEVI